MNKKPLLIFDCFGVIIKDDISTVWLKEHFNNETISILRRDFFPKSDIGDISCDDLFKELSRLSKIDIAQIRNDFFTSIIYDNQTIELIKELKNDYHIALLSNAPQEICNHITKRNDIFDLFDEIVFSCECHMIKPNKDIYNFLLSKFEGNYHYSVMIDDNPTNLDGAINAGIDYTIEFKNAESTKELLNKIKNKCI